MIQVLVWAEDRPLAEHQEKMKKIYPLGIQTAIADFLKKDEKILVCTATMQDKEQGLSKEILDKTDVLVFWSHKHWRELKDEYAERIRERVLDGMGLIALHSAHASKVMSLLLGTRTMRLHWRENDERQRYWIVAPDHLIVQGIEEEYFDIPMDETYWEYFEIPQPEEQVLITSSEKGEIFRSGCCWKRGKGKIFYFQGGHETYPVYYQTEVQKILTNAVHWCAYKK